MRRTVSELAAEVSKRLEGKTFTLVYVNYDDMLMDEQVNALIAGDFETLWESMDEWLSDAQHYSAREALDELVKDIVRDWNEDEDLADEFRDSDAWHEAIFEVMERDDSKVLDDLIRNTPDPMLRVQLVDEDHAWTFEPIEPDALLSRVGLPLTKSNMAEARRLLAESSPEYHVRMAYLIFTADLAEIADAPEDAEIEVIDPYIWLCNPFMGDGWVNETPFSGSIRVKRSELRTDKGAFGYGWTEVAGTYASAYEREIKVHVPEVAST